MRKTSAPTDWRDRVAEAVFSSRALRRPDTKQGAARLLEGPLEFLHSKDAASIAARHDAVTFWRGSLGASAGVP